MAVYVLEQVPVENRGIVSAIGAFAWGINVLVVGVVGYLMRNVNWRYVQFMSGSHGIHTIAAYWYVFPIDEKQIEIIWMGGGGNYLINAYHVINSIINYIFSYDSYKGKHRKL